jgi:hypothetical protein
MPQPARAEGAARAPRRWSLRRVDLGVLVVLGCACIAAERDRPALHAPTQLVLQEPASAATEASARVDVVAGRSPAGGQSASTVMLSMAPACAFYATPWRVQHIIHFIMHGADHRAVDYELSERDYVTLARAVELEGPPEDAVAWTLLQRFAYLYPRYASVAKFVEAYAQPINPAWFPSGALHLGYAQSLREAGKLRDAELEDQRAIRRVANARMPLRAIRSEVLQIIDALFASGADSPYPGSVHYCAPTLHTRDVVQAAAARAAYAAENRFRAEVDVGDPRTENWFFSVSGAATFRVQLAERRLAICHNRSASF